MHTLIRVGAALLLLGVAGCGDIVARPTPTPTAPPTTASVPEVVTPATPTALAAMTPAAAADAVRTQVAVTPRLLPTAFLAGMEAIVTAGPGSYRIQYTDDTHTRTIVLDDAGGGFGINGPHQVVRDVPFRGATATYFIFDTTVPTSRRSLYWQEVPGLQFSIVTTGFAEDDFWRIANSLQPV